MTTIEPPRRHHPAGPMLVALAAATMTAGLFVGAEVVAAGLAVAMLAGIVVIHRPTLTWTSALTALVLVILFVPIRRYRFPGDLPFQLEPYRVLVALIVAGWLASLLSDSRVRLRRSGFEGTMTLIVVATIGSVLVNPDRLTAYQSTVLKSLTFFLSFVLVFYLVVSVVRTRASADALVKTLVAGGSVIAVLAIVEGRTGSNPFTGLDTVVPVLISDTGAELTRGGTTRAFGPAEHPIALSAALAMLLPLAIYLARVSGPRWLIAVGALTVGTLSTVSRTGFVMLVVAALVFLALKPRETRRLWPLVVPVLVATHFLLPGTLGSIREAFFPEGGLIAQQSDEGTNCDSGGRIADLGPTIDEVKKKPLLGYGYGTRIVTGPEQNACVLDNQWLGSLVELGVVGVLAWLWLFLSVLRKMGRRAKEDDSPTSWLLVAIAASVIAFAVGMASYDALGFVQVTLLLFILLALGAAAIQNDRSAKSGTGIDPIATG